jgi:hypothetical protein
MDCPCGLPRIAPDRRSSFRKQIQGRLDRSGIPLSVDMLAVFVEILLEIFGHMLSLFLGSSGEPNRLPNK